MSLRSLPGAERARDSSPSAIALAHFSVLWAIAALFHIASGSDWRTSSPAIAGAAWVLVRPGGGAMVVIAAFAVIQQSGLGERLGAPEPFLYLWAFYGVALMIGYVVVMRGAWWAATPIHAGFRLQPAMAALPIVVVLNGLSPYLGLKTETSWAMFSNLRTEGGLSNHWFVPTSIQMFEYQRDMVELVEVSDRGLQDVTNHGLLIPYFEIRRKPWMAIAYRENGEVHRFNTVAVAAASQQPCVH